MCRIQLNEDAIGMGYIQTPDRGGVRESRQCWKDIIIGRYVRVFLVN